ncbi:hypothetical protein Ab1vBOLIVR2_gp47 [Agrobacterium phage OLIVR2]|uniref:Uncharacterized protein n=1 Tax=Agrobacterium phage OLIVR1 TaxID=2723769 RepID=A0A858MR38_9CAUD|nr:hypothetical protein KNU98_gp062 [Agrobacterium phage OLIVR1]QIW87242.1 hypothetical protein Ab1vBOLIVR1_gp47 [Agrobacterium phage OLIVR1]QIW87350.1 hypothetical protein Ab1vBOLIVR2_gp47 [Agrobacterium phage OLIVR2]QIW87457.1 hypothetical protein Ab1vBOLIVR3_gp47 [Agrobacterium phage OLIVR3]
MPNTNGTSFECNGVPASATVIQEIGDRGVPSHPYLSSSILRRKHGAISMSTMY